LVQIHHKEEKMNKKIIILVLIFLLLPPATYAVTRNADSCSIADISTQLSASSTGDTINVPAGDCSWDTSGGTSLNYGSVVVNKAINIIGAGADLGGGTSKTTCDPASNTCITHTAAHSSWYAAIIGTSGMRISGMSFTTSTPGYVAIIWPGNGTRIDHCKFVGFHHAIYGGGNQSVIDNNEFYGGGVQLPNGTGSTYWAAATGLGSADFFFVENNKFSNVGALTTVLHFIALNSGSRVVARYNDFAVDQTVPSYGVVGDIFDAHGYCHATDLNNGRAARAYEVYNNKQTQIGGTSASYCNEGVYLRGGTGVVYNNKFGCYGYTRGGALYLYDWRSNNFGDSTVGDVCYATAPNTGGAYYCYSPAYRVLATAAVSADVPGETVTGATSGASGIAIGYDGNHYIYFESITNGPFQSGENLQVGGVTKNVAAGDSAAYAGEGYPCVDQIGRGQNQASEPIYMWGNVDKDGAAINSATAAQNLSGYITVDTDYIMSSKSGYSAYTCPHPLAGLTGSCTTGSSAVGTAYYNVSTAAPLSGGTISGGRIVR
jgi:hypothetical protein